MSHWSRVQEVFLEAIERDEASRRAWAVAESGEDEALRDDVLSLLASHDRAGDFIETAAIPRGAMDAAWTDAGSAEVEAPLPVDTIVAGRYRLGELLGRGGMGSVYRATHLDMLRPVALKILHRDLVRSADAVERFRREARALALVHHPRLVTVYDFGVAADAGAFIAMELLEGRTLAEELAERGRIEPARATEIVRLACEGVHAAHEKGVFHRDLKPDNIFLETTADGTTSVKVVDFGVAWLRDAAATPLTARSTLVGTPLYMSPEQCEGEAPDARSDVYALGCVLYTLLTGSPPFSSETLVGLIAKHLSAEPRPPSLDVPDLSPAIEAVVLCALAKRREDRFPTADALARALAGEEGFAIAASSPARQTAPGLPGEGTSFVGRERELAAVEALVGTSRLVTLGGPGGSGKTRLALRATARVASEFPDGVRFVELAPLADAALVADAVALALGARDADGRPPRATIAERIGARRMLVVLDNCEHVLDGACDLVVALLRECPSLSVLATSREPLGLAAERVHIVPPLAVPPADVGDVRGLYAYEASRLFVERATARNDRLTIADESVPAVARICRRLDGIPLALELAAARSGSLSFEQIADRLDERFDLLTTRDRTAPARHRTLRGALAWSYDLLSDAERTVFDRTSVFAGGFSLDAALEVCAGGDVDESDVLDLVSRLVDKSLLVADLAAGGVRYDALETVRAFAAERLGARADAGATRDRHAAHFLHLAEAAGARLAGPDQVRWLGRLDAEHDNTRAALEWLREASPDRFLSLASSLAQYWLIRNAMEEGRAQLDAALAGAPSADAATRGRALVGSGLLARAQLDHTAAEALFGEALELFERLADEESAGLTLSYLAYGAETRGRTALGIEHATRAIAIGRAHGSSLVLATALNNLGTIQYRTGDLAGAEAAFEEALPIARALGDLRTVANIAGNLTVLVATRGDFDRALELSLETVEIRRRIGEVRRVALGVNNAGEIAKLTGDFDRAGAYLAEGLRLFDASGDRLGVASALEGIAGLTAYLGRSETAFRLFGAASALRERIESPMTPGDAAELDRLLAPFRDEDSARADALVAEGRALPLARAVEEALATAAPPSHAPTIDPLRRVAESV